MGEKSDVVSGWLFALLVIIQIVLLVLNYGFDLQMPMWALLFPTILFIAILIFLLIIIVGLLVVWLVCYIMG